MMILKLLFTFFKIGAFTFGGGYAMLPLIEAEVMKNGWIEAESLVNFIAVSESTPGPFAINISTYIGRQLAGIPGALFSTLGVVLPSFIIILIVAHCFEKFKNSAAVKGCMSGLKPATIGLIASAVISIGKTALFPSGFDIKLLYGYRFICSAVIFAIMAYLTFGRKLHPIAVILLSAVLGIITGYAQGIFL